MSSSPSVSTQDLRSHAVEYKRDKTHAAKWALGESPVAPGGRTPPLEGMRRPAKPYSAKINAAIHRQGHKDMEKLSHQSKLARKHQIDEEQSSSDSAGLSDEDAVNPTPGPVTDADVTYTYDGAAGPGRGCQILGLALDQAVERFETRQTDKLIKDEYEVVSQAGIEDVNTKPHSITEADDFELI